MGSGDRGGEEVVAPSESVVATSGGTHERQYSGTHRRPAFLEDREPTQAEQARAAAREEEARQTSGRVSQHFPHPTILEHVLACMNATASAEGRGITFRLPTSEEGNAYTIVFSSTNLQSCLGSISVTGRVVVHSRLDGDNGKLHIMPFSAQLQVYEFLGNHEILDLMVERFEVRSSDAPSARVWDYNSDADSQTAYRPSRTPAPKQHG